MRLVAITKVAGNLRPPDRLRYLQVPKDLPKSNKARQLFGGGANQSPELGDEVFLAET